MLAIRRSGNHVAVDPPAATSRAPDVHDLRETQRLESVGLIAGGVVHDVKNLLLAVHGNAAAILAEGGLDERTRRRAERIELAARRAADLAGQLLAYSGRGDRLDEELDLSVIVAEIRELLGAALPPNAELVLDLGGRLPAVTGAAWEIRQVLMNLITNAAEALESATGEVRVRTGVVEADRRHLSRFRFGDALPAGRYVFVEVSDTGTGMDAETAARIFEPFFTTKCAGRGLGLAATLGIVQAHGGGLRVQSERGEGSTFEVVLPAVPAAAEDAAREGSRPPSASGTILVADDEAVVREVTTLLLEEAGFTVIAAADGTEALERFAEHAGDVDLLLLDVMMPGLGGEEVLERVWAQAPGVPVILTSGYDERERVDRLSARGRAHFLQKPYSGGELVETLRAALDA